MSFEWCTRDGYLCVHECGDGCKKAVAALKAERDGLRKALQWIAEQRWDENADLDTICTHAEKALATPPDTDAVKVGPDGDN